MRLIQSAFGTKAVAVTVSGDRVNNLGNTLVYASSRRIEISDSDEMGSCRDFRDEHLAKRGELSVGQEPLGLHLWFSGMDSQGSSQSSGIMPQPLTSLYVSFRAASRQRAAAAGAISTWACSGTTAGRRSAAEETCAMACVTARKAWRASRQGRMNLRQQ